jgi:hypothetical protein
MSEDRPLLDTIMEMTAASISRADLDGRDIMMVRLAALAASDAGPASYLLNLAAATETDLTFEDVQGALIAVSPIIGTARTMSAASAIATALGFALDIEDAIERQEASA